MFAQVVSICQLSRAGTCPRDSLASLSFSVALFVKERAVDRVSFVLTPRGLLGNLKFTAKYQQIERLQRLQLMCYALNQLSHIIYAKSLTSVIYISCSVCSLYKCTLGVCEFELATGVSQHHSPSVFFFGTQPSCDAAIDLHTGDSDDNYRGLSGHDKTCIFT